VSPLTKRSLVDDDDRLAWFESRTLSLTDSMVPLAPIPENYKTGVIRNTVPLITHEAISSCRCRTCRLFPSIARQDIASTSP
jgi:hypothetical protein